MKMIPTLLLTSGFLLVASPAFSAEMFNERCSEITTCAKAVGELLSQRYLFDAAEMKGKMVVAPNLELTRENAELLFTALLNAEGYTRVPIGQPGLYQLMRQRDARDSAIPVFTADAKSAPELPNHWDLVTLKYKASHPESIEQMARTSRSFMPANSRIIPEELSGTLIVTDSAINVKKLYQSFRDMDRAPSPELLKRWKAREAGSQAREHEGIPAAAPDGARKKSPAPAGKPHQNCLASRNVVVFNCI